MESGMLGLLTLSRLRVTRSNSQSFTNKGNNHGSL
jgi:hypothetical protein